MKARFFIVFLTLFATAAIAEPPPGHPSVGEAHSYMQMPDEASFPHLGQVLQSIPSNDYVYLEVATEGKPNIWIAAPRGEVAVHSYIRYGDGVVMNNFFSRKHQRTFDAVMFVKEIRQLGN